MLQLISEGLGSEAVPIATERMLAHGSGPGLVKAEFNSVSEKVAVLRKKRLLKERGDYGNVYIRSAKSHTARLIEINFKTLLKEIPGGSEFYVAGNGRLRRKEAALMDEAAGGREDTSRQRTNSGRHTERQRQSRGRGARGK